MDHALAVGKGRRHGALIGGVLGGRLAGRVKPSTLRWTVVAIGVLIAIIYFVRG